MKRTATWIVIFVVSVLTLVAASANAATYTVKKGDNLSKIGKMYNLTWQAITEANMDKVKNPHRIFPGQILTIPEKGLAIVKTKKPFIWKRAAIKAFGKRNSTKAIMSFDLAQEVKDIFIAQVKSGEFEMAQLQFGQHLDQMIFDNYQVVSNIIVQIPKKRRNIKIYPPVRFGNKVYHLVDPIVCNNWAWWLEELPPPPPTKPEPAPLPEPEPVPPPVIIKPAEKPKPKLLLVKMMVWEDEEVSEAPEIPLPLPVIEEKSRPDFEAWAYAGSYSGIQSNSHDWNFYKGGNISLFPYQFKFDGAVFRLGPSYQWVDWQGEVGDIIKYSGQMSLVGGEAQYITGSTKSQLKLYYGKKTDDIDGRGDLAALRSRQWNRMLAVEPSHQWWHDGKWFTEFEIGARLEFDLGGSKHSSFANQKIDDPRTGQGVFMMRAKTNVYKFYNDNAVLTFQLAPGYEQSPETWFIEPRAGIKFFEIAELAVSYKWDEGPQNDLVAGHIVLNAGELIKRVWQIFKKGGNKEVIRNKELGIRKRGK